MILVLDYNPSYQVYKILAVTALNYNPEEKRKHLIDRINKIQAYAKGLDEEIRTLMIENSDDSHFLLHIFTPLDMAQMNTEAIALYTHKAQERINQLYGQVLPAQASTEN